MTAPQITIDGAKDVHRRGVRRGQYLVRPAIPGGDVTQAEAEADLECESSLAISLRKCSGRAKTRMRTRDSQRSKVYAWERTVSNDEQGAEMSLEECAVMIRRALSWYGLSGLPRIKDGRGTRLARGSDRAINLPRWARRPRSVLHEAAHSVVESFSTQAARSDSNPRSARPAWHGPEFVTVYIDILERTKIGRGVVLRRSARTAGVNLARRQTVPQMLGLRAVTKWTTLS